LHVLPGLIARVGAVASSILAAPPLADGWLPHVKSATFTAAYDATLTPLRPRASP
jgi:hypothetical protein